MQEGDVREASVIPGLGRSPGEGHSNTLQYSCLESPVDRGAWWATVHGVTKSEALAHTHTHVIEATVLLSCLLFPAALGLKLCLSQHQLYYFCPLFLILKLFHSPLFVKITYLFWLHWVSIAAHRLSLITEAALHCSV